MELTKREKRMVEMLLHKEIDRVSEFDTADRQDVEELWTILKKIREEK